MTALELLAARRLQFAAAGGAAAVAFAAADASAVPLAAAVGFFAAKSVESLRRATR